MHMARPPWQLQQSQPSAAPLQRVPSKQTSTFSSPLVALIQGHEPGGKAGGGGGNDGGSGAAGGTGADGGGGGVGGV